MQFLSIFIANGALQVEQFFREAPKDLHRCRFVVQKHIAPHGRVRGRNPGEIPKTRCRKRNHFFLGNPFQIVGHTHHGIRNQMRRMRCHSQNQIVMFGIHFSHVRSKRLPKRA